MSPGVLGPTGVYKTELARALADRGYDPVYRARPLKRAIQRYLQDPLAPGKFGEGYTVEVDVAGDLAHLERYQFIDSVDMVLSQKSGFAKVS